MVFTKFAEFLKIIKKIVGSLKIIIDYVLLLNWSAIFAVMAPHQLLKFFYKIG